MASAASASTALSPAAGAGAAASDESFDGLVPGYSIRLLGPRNARNIPTMKFIVSAQSAWSAVAPVHELAAASSAVAS